MTYINDAMFGHAIGLFTRALVALCVATVLVMASAANAAELVMFRRDGCSWCAKWDREIGPIYGRTDFNRRAPLRHLNIDRDAAPTFVHAPVRYTPTFVLVDHGREVSRIEGYPGEDFFWARLANLLEKLPPAEPSDPSAPTRIRFDVLEHAQ